MQQLWLAFSKEIMCEPNGLVVGTWSSIWWGPQLAKRIEI
jgi:hypothetical protein